MRCACVKRAIKMQQFHICFSQIPSEAALCLCTLRKLFAFPRQEPIKTNPALILVGVPRGWEGCEGCPLSEPVVDMHGCWHAFCGTWCMWPLPLSTDRELPCHLAGGMPTLFWIGLSNSHYPWWGPQRPHPCAGCLLTMGWSCRWLFRAHRWISHVLGYPRPPVQRPVTMQ